MVRMSCDIETNIVSVERMDEYSTLKTEAPEEIPTSRPPMGWPSSGGIRFVGYSTRYRENLDLVLKGISFNIEPGEKIGVVGRTGAGASLHSILLFDIQILNIREIVLDARPLPPH